MGKLSIILVICLFSIIELGHRIRVVSILSTPFVMEKKEYQKWDDNNDRYEGYCIDLINELARMLNFRYELYLVPDGKFGHRDNRTGRWTGMIGQLVDRRADLALGPITITSERETAIDFTMPFMNSGISILFKIPHTQSSDYFWFLSPFTVNIWLYILLACVLVTIAMIIVGRLTQNRSGKGDRVTLASSIWFTLATLLRMSGQFGPRSISVRMVAFTWMLFTMFLACIYIATLVTSMAMGTTTKHLVFPFENAEELAQQTDITYGALEGGSTMSFFRNSRNQIFMKMGLYMDNHPGYMMRTYEEGIKKVLDGNYAFLMESSMLEYMTERNCDLVQVGGLLDNKAYAIGIQFGSPWRMKLSEVMLQLQESGYMNQLKQKWFYNSGKSCPSREQPQSAGGPLKPLDEDFLAVLFYMLFAGLVLSIVVAMVEFCFTSRKTPTTEKQTIRRLFSDSLRIVVRGDRVGKPGGKPGDIVTGTNRIVEK